MPNDADGSPRAEILPFRPRQPEPINYSFRHEVVDGRPRTHISRNWRVEDARRCTLCAACTASVATTGETAMCLKTVEAHVAEPDVPLFRDDASFRRAADQRDGSAAG